MNKLNAFAAIFLFLLTFKFACSFIDENRLHDDLLSSYAFPVRPVENFNDTLDVKLRFQLLQVEDLNVKDQLLTLIVLLDQQWTDYKLKWDPSEYDGISYTRLPISRIWQTDFKLTQGDYESTGSLAEVHSNGLVKWKPVVKLVSFCLIELSYYPFDIQTCSLDIKSWTYDGHKLYPRLMDMHDVDKFGRGMLYFGMSLDSYQNSTEWELIAIPAEAIVKFASCCPWYSFKFNVTLRRHSYFYLTNLLLPLLLLSYLSLVVFYLPADSCEKITLCVTILASQVMFLLLMMDNIPVTSLAVPLLGKIIIFNMILVFFSVVCTTIVLNIHFRNPNTHRLPGWINRLRCSVIPRLLLLEVIPNPNTKRESSNETKDENESVSRRSRETSNSGIELKEVSRFCSLSLIEIRTCADQQLKKQKKIQNAKYSKRFLQKALANIFYVRNYVQRLDDLNKTCEEWKFIASVLDRIFLIAFNIVFVIGNWWIISDAEALFDQRFAIGKWTRSSQLRNPNSA